MGISSFSALPVPLYRAQQVRELDRLAIDVHGISGLTLMKRAGRAAFDLVLSTWPDVAAISVFCGAGNNGGDGYVVAALAAQRRIDVQVVQVGAVDRLRGEALAAYRFACQEQVKMVPFPGDQTSPVLKAMASGTHVVVDALLGTGLQGVVKAPYADAIDCINQSSLPVLAVDIPSGLCADTGRVWGNAVAADLTATFIGMKQGLLTGRGPALTGGVHFAGLGAPQAIYAHVEVAVERLELPALLAQVPRRLADAHKGHFGHVLVIGGDTGMGGAVAMAAEAAARVGAGLVSVATRPEHVAAILARTPEVMASGVSSGQALGPLLARADILVVGPGLGRSSWSEQMLQQAVKSKSPLLLDADALFLLSQGRVVVNTHRHDWVLTPHVGEAARLLHCNSADIQSDRFAAIEKLQHTYGGIVVLKGAGSLVKSEEGTIKLANCGNPGMACGGMGDVLSGIIGGLLAQKLNRELAVDLGVCLHGTAGDIAAQEGGQIGLLATDLIFHMRQLLNGSSDDKTSG